MKQQGKVALASIAGFMAGAAAVATLEAVRPRREPDAVLKRALAAANEANGLNQVLLRRVAAEEVPELQGQVFQGTRFALSDEELISMAKNVDRANAELLLTLKGAGISCGSRNLTALIPPKRN